MPAINKCTRFAVAGDAYRELRRLALAVTAYRVKSGKFPERQDDLAPDFLARPALDPYDGQPLRMKRDGMDMLKQDEKLRREFEARLASDPKFAASPAERLRFFHQRSPYWDQRLNLYPVYRTDAVPAGLVSAR